MKTTKTIVIIDYNTHKLTDLLDTLTETYPVSVVSPHHLSDLPIPTAKILSVVLLCRVPDAAVLQAIQKLKMYHGHLAIAILSPKPSTVMITEALTTGATSYFDLSEDEPIRLFQWLNHLNNTQRTPSVWSWFLAFLFPKRAISSPTSSPTYRQVYPQTIANQLVSIEPVIAAVSQVIPAFKGQETERTAVTDLIEVQFFGEFSVKINGTPVASKSNGLLLAYLFFHHKQPVHKEKLMSKFWGENVNDAKNCLNVAICSLRKTLKELVPEKTPIILFQNDYYALNTAYWRIETDIDQFTQRWEKARTLLRTQGLATTVEELKSLKTVYRDEFLPHFNHEWAVGKRDEYREKYLQALNLLGEHYWKTQEFNDCITCCQDILRVDACVEATHVRLMGCFIQLKMKDRAVRQYKKCVEALQKLNMTPERETEHLYQSILMV